MKRLTVPEVLQAYKDTGAIPCRNTYRTIMGKNVYCCGLGVAAFSARPTMAEGV